MVESANKENDTELKYDFIDKGRQRIGTKSILFNAIVTTLDRIEVKS